METSDDMPVPSRTKTRVIGSKYPASLAPTGFQRIALADGRAVDIAQATPTFSRWTGEMPSDTYNGRPVLRLSDEMVLAELAILRIFEQDGWEGCWVDSYRKRFLTGYWPEPRAKDLPALQKLVFDSIRDKAGGTGGCFDVFCWRDRELRFIESKWKGRDQINDNQRRWLQAALESGISVDSFLIVEWTMTDE